MKKFLLAFSLLTIIATTSAFAGNGKTLPTMTPEQRVDYDFKSQLNVPRNLSEIPGEYSAEMHFHVTPQGGIIVNEIISDNDELKHSLMYQTKSILVKTDGLDLTTGYKVTFRFKVQEVSE